MDIVSFLTMEYIPLNKLELCVAFQNVDSKCYVSKVKCTAFNALANQGSSSKKQKTQLCEMDTKGEAL